MHPASPSGEAARSPQFTVNNGIAARQYLAGMGPPPGLPGSPSYHGHPLHMGSPLMHSAYSLGTHPPVYPPSMMSNSMGVHLPVGSQLHPNFRPPPVTQQPPQGYLFSDADVAARLEAMPAREASEVWLLLNPDRQTIVLPLLSYNAQVKVLGTSPQLPTGLSHTLPARPQQQRSPTRTQQQRSPTRTQQQRSPSRRPSPPPPTSASAPSSSQSPQLTVTEITKFWKDHIDVQISIVDWWHDAQEQNSSSSYVVAKPLAAGPLWDSIATKARNMYHVNLTSDQIRSRFAKIKGAYTVMSDYKLNKLPNTTGGKKWEDLTGDEKKVLLSDGNKSNTYLPPQELLDAMHLRAKGRDVVNAPTHAVDTMLQAPPAAPTQSKPAAGRPGRAPQQAADTGTAGTAVGGEAGPDVVDLQEEGGDSDGMLLDEDELTADAALVQEARRQNAHLYEDGEEMDTAVKASVAASKKRRVELSGKEGVPSTPELRPGLTEKRRRNSERAVSPGSEAALQAVKENTENMSQMRRDMAAAQSSRAKRNIEMMDLTKESLAMHKQASDRKHTAFSQLLGSVGDMMVEARRLADASERQTEQGAVKNAIAAAKAELDMELQRLQIAAMRRQQSENDKENKRV